MPEATHLLPHAERLTRRIEGLEAPLIEVWGWPGSGADAVLQTLQASLGARGLALAELADDAAARAALAAAVGSRFLVVAGDPGERLAQLGAWLRPGQQLAFASHRRRSVAAQAVALIPPAEVLLTVAEVARLWYLMSGQQPRDGAAETLWRATDGWLRPLRLALEATGGAGLDGATAEQLVEMTPVRWFVRHEVLEPLPVAARAALLEAPVRRPPAMLEPRAPMVPSASSVPGKISTVGGAELAWAAADDLGLWLEEEEEDRLPALLTAYLDRERRRARHRARAAAGESGRGGQEAADSGSTRAARGAPHVHAGDGTEGVQADGTGSAAVHRQRGRPRYRVRLFGDAVVHQEGEEGGREVGWKLRRSFLVLAFLASSPDLQAGREDLEEAVWPADGERTIDRNFHPTLSHLRRALELGGRGSMPPPLLYRGGAYRLNPEVEWDIDLQEFNRRRAEGRQLLASRGGERAAAESWRGAWQLYRGPFLHGHYEAWVMARREEYQRHYIELLRELGDVAMRLEQGPSALDAYRAVLLEDPLQERTHVLVMRLYAGMGRRDLVRRQYERLCTLLLDELGVEPLPETVQEYHRLMS